MFQLPKRTKYWTKPYFIERKNEKISCKQYLISTIYSGLLRIAILRWFLRKAKNALLNPQLLSITKCSERFSKNLYFVKWRSIENLRLSHFFIFLFSWLAPAWLLLCRCALWNCGWDNHPSKLLKKIWSVVFTSCE